MGIVLNYEESTLHHKLRFPTTNNQNTLFEENIMYF